MPGLRPDDVLAHAERLHGLLRLDDRAPLHPKPAAVALEAAWLARRHYENLDAELDRPVALDVLAAQQAELARCAGALTHGFTLYGLTWEECNDLADYEVTEVVAAVTPNLRLKPGLRHAELRERLGRAGALAQIVRMAAISQTAQDLRYTGGGRLANHREDLRLWVESVLLDLDGLGQLRKGPLEARVVELKAELRQIRSRVIHARKASASRFQLRNREPVALVA